jgi:hypothetical protein
LFGVPALVSGGAVIVAFGTGTSAVVFRAPSAGFDRELPGYDFDVPPGWVATNGYLGSSMEWTVREGGAAIDARFAQAIDAARDLPNAQ